MIQKRKKYSIIRAIALGILSAFNITQVISPFPSVAQAQTIIDLPAPGKMLSLTAPLTPPILRGLAIHSKNPFRFDFIVDKGSSPPLFFKEGVGGSSLKDEYTKLIKYFLATLTIPEEDLWVNLSPYEKNRIVPESFGQTEMGRDLLAQDYILKQIMASLTYPESDLGKKFRQEVYQKAYAQYGTTHIPISTFNKVWIVPDKAVVYENAKAGTAYVVESKLKVMLEEDYLALNKNAVRAVRGPLLQNQLGSQTLREIILPVLTKEINEGKNFA